MKSKQHPGLKWLGRVVFVLLVLVSLALIFNEQIKSWLVSSYSPWAI